MSDDLTTAYLLGAEQMRDKLHKQADDIERLRAENEKLREAFMRFYDAALEEVDDNEMSWTIRDWWREELKAAAVALKGSEDE